METFVVLAAALATASFSAVSLLWGKISVVNVQGSGPGLVLAHFTGFVITRVFLFYRTRREAALRKKYADVMDDWA